MLDAIWWAICQSWKVLGLVGAWLLFRYIVTNGSATMSNLFETIDMGIQAACFGLKQCFWEIIKKGKRKEKPVKTDGSVE